MGSSGNWTVLQGWVSMTKCPCVGKRAFTQAVPVLQLSREPGPAERGALGLPQALHAPAEWEVGACVSRDLCRRRATALSGKAGLCTRSVCATGKGQHRYLGFLKGVSPTVSRGDWFPGDRVLNWVSDWLCSFSVKHKRWKHWVSARSFIQQVLFAQGFWDRCRDWAVSIGLMC